MLSFENLNLLHLNDGEEGPEATAGIGNGTGIGNRTSREQSDAA